MSYNIIRRDVPLAEYEHINHISIGPSESSHNNGAKGITQIADNRRSGSRDIFEMGL